VCLLLASVGVVLKFQEPAEVVVVRRFLGIVRLPPGKARLRPRMVLLSESALSWRAALR
jgi:hypothetical protein